MLSEDDYLKPPRGLNCNERPEGLPPHEPVSQYRRNRSGEDKGDAHLKRQIMGREVVAAVTDGKVDFGPREQVFSGDFEGRRKKRVLEKIIGE